MLKSIFNFIAEHYHVETKNDILKIIGLHLFILFGGLLGLYFFVGDLTGLSADGKTRTVGIRQTCHPIARALCEQVCAPFIATSANYSGAIGRKAAPESLADIPLSFQDQVDIIVDGGVLSGVPSTVVDCVSNPPRVLRKGAISLSASELQINF